MATAPAPIIPPAGAAEDAWQAAIKAAHTKALAALPAANGRLERALRLVQAGAVEAVPELGAQYYTCASESDSSGMAVYDVHAQHPTTCTCEDFEQHATHTNAYACKHILAIWIYKRALEQLPPATEPVREVQGESAAAGATLPEAAFSLCLRGRLDGQDAQLTIRGQTFAEFRANVTAVRGLLDAAPEGEVHGAPSTTPPDDQAVCKYHGKMKASTKAPGTYYCPKLLADDSYCASRWPEK